MIKNDFPILEYDHADESVLRPPTGGDVPLIPERAVACFEQRVVDTLAADGTARIVHNLKSNMGSHPIYELEAFGTKIGVFQPGLGAPFAAAFLEEVIALGCRKIVVCGTCGVLDGTLPKGMVVLISSAVRDDGTSYHYAPPAREIGPTPETVETIEEVLKTHGCHYALGKTWTTDGVYRETRKKVQARRAEGCLVVEMEAAALFAVAHYRNAEIGQIVSCSDDVSGDVWDSRRDHALLTSGEKLFWLSAEACAKL